MVRSFSFLREEGFFRLGQLTTSPLRRAIGKAGLLQILNQGGEVYAAVTNYMWPGSANVRICYFSVFRAAGMATVS